ncbi:MAG: DUF2782 domain-containing protein [Magnetococcales bacterium]|nr:DUF2782 domain-containing protein [Magnetococcales bacterium]
MLSPFRPCCISILNRRLLQAGLLLGLFCLLPGDGTAAEERASGKAQAAAAAAMPDEHTRKAEGFSVPAKGPLVAELREKLDPDAAAAETVIRRYEEYNGITVREYLINNTVFQVEVTPANGPPYYLIDVEGNGLFQEKYIGFQPRLVVPQWVLFRF